MKTSLRRLFKNSIFAAACLTATSALAAVPTNDVAPKPSTQQDPLSLKDAEAIALRAVPGGRVLSVERETEWGRAVFEVEILDGEGWEIELLIDAADGKVLRQRRDD